MEWLYVASTHPRLDRIEVAQVQQQNYSGRTAALDQATHVPNRTLRSSIWRADCKVLVVGRRSILHAGAGVETGGFAPLFRVGLMVDKFS
jgi:hypothetical protein